MHFFAASLVGALTDTPSVDPFFDPHRCVPETGPINEVRFRRETDNTNSGCRHLLGQIASQDAGPEMTTFSRDHHVGTALASHIGKQPRREL